MNTEIQKYILEKTGATSIAKVELIQKLWSDFGSLERLYLVGAKYKTVVLKRIQVPKEMKHPRGWNSTASVERKLKSYKIELYWYEHYVLNLPEDLKTPIYLGSIEDSENTYLLIEDLMPDGFSENFDFSNRQHFYACIDWLAKFHAHHINSEPEGLWEVGTYWHLQTRKEEFARMSHSSLKENAANIDMALNQCSFKTLVHGDAKPANFLFSKDGAAAAVDYQYVGGGCGMKDLIYLMNSALKDQELFTQENAILDAYFRSLEKFIGSYQKQGVDFNQLREEWLKMYLFAWADFVRFLEGWSPKHVRNNDFARAKVCQWRIKNGF